MQDALFQNVMFLTYYIIYYDLLLSLIDYLIN